MAMIKKHCMANSARPRIGKGKGKRGSFKKGEKKGPLDGWVKKTAEYGTETFKNPKNEKRKQGQKERERRLNGWETRTRMKHHERLGPRMPGTIIRG